MLAHFSLGLLLSAGFTQAVQVYLSPTPALSRSSLSPEDASAALSRHLGLEAFQPLLDASDIGHQEEWFVGRGSKNALLVTLEDNDVEAVIPESLQPAFTLTIATPVNSLSSVISTYLHHARHTFASLYSSREFGQSSDVQSLTSFFESAGDSAFAAIDLIELSKLGQTHGRSSEEYKKVANRLREFFEHVVEDTDFNLAILAFTSPASTSFVKRQAKPQQSQTPLPPNTPPPQQPIGSISTCFADVDACNNSTSTCSGRGKCVEATKAGRTCFVCSCGVTKTGEGNKVKTVTWAGGSCERQDISGYVNSCTVPINPWPNYHGSPFVLLTGTVIVIILCLVHC
ncbi:hypothetical protein B0H34DRAFT_697792 [Crassisporium funariophilum]|nr:hypothetical protein B0H34DRAFT_697792 [Crassisporium funariophilum]